MKLPAEVGFKVVQSFWDFWAKELKVQVLFGRVVGATLNTHPQPLWARKPKTWFLLPKPRGRSLVPLQEKDIQESLCVSFLKVLRQSHQLSINQTFTGLECHYQCETEILAPMAVILPVSSPGGMEWCSPDVGQPGGTDARSAASAKRQSSALGKTLGWQW